ncbi:MAG: lipopolysaccharide biosynthesis protein, partial [Chloroflexota bacterium]
MGTISPALVGAGIDPAEPGRAAESRPSRGQKAASGTIQNMLAHVLLFPTGFVVAGFLSRTLGPANYGTLAVASSLVAWLEFLVAGIFVQAVVTFVAETADWGHPATTAARFQGGCGLLVGLVLFVTAPAVAAALGSPALGPYLRLFAIDVPLASMVYLYSAVLTGREQFGANAATSAIYWVARMAFILLLVSLTGSISGAIVGTICASVVTLIASRLFVAVPMFRASSFPIRRLVTYGGATVLFAVADSLFDKAGLFFVKGMDVHAADAGFYSAASALAVVPTLFAGAFVPLLLTSIVKEMAAEHPEKVRTLVGQGNRLLLLLLPFAGITAACSSEIVNLIYGPGFAPAAPFFVVLSFSTVAMAVITMAVSLLTAAGKLRCLLALSIPLLPVLLAACYVMTRTFGGIGAAWATLLVSVAAALAGAIMIRRVMGVYARP